MTKLSCQFRSIKDPTQFEEQHDIVYHSFRISENCKENYIGESARWLGDRTKDHNVRDHNSHLLKNSIKSRHDSV